MKKTNVEKFLGIKAVKNILFDYNITDVQKSAIELYFEINGYRNSQDRYPRLAWFLKQGIVNLIDRETELLKYNRMSVEYFRILYGSKLGEHKWYANLENIKSYLPSRIIYWENKGYSLEDAESMVKTHQKTASQQSLFREHKKFSVRCKEYWMDKGYDEELAIDLVGKSQTRDLPFYIEKYGEELGNKKYRYSCNKRIKTWENKTPEERHDHYLKTLPIIYNENGQEMQAIKLFLQQNNIPENNCMFGAPKDQFYQWIPDYGFRRYDLAVFADHTKKELISIMEFHGPGHINFSDYAESMSNSIIEINGKKLPHLGTYGNSYRNDYRKRDHIENVFPNVKYYVFWNTDLKIKDLKIKCMI
jgi:hypothetical protein